MFVAEHLKHYSASTNTLVSTDVAKLSSKFFRFSLSLPLILLRYIVFAPTRCVLIMFILTSSFLLFSILFQTFADFLFIFLFALFNAKGENNNTKIASSLETLLMQMHFSVSVILSHTQWKLLRLQFYRFSFVKLC